VNVPHQARGVLPDLQPWRTDRIDGMVVEWDVGIRVDDGLVLRADVFRPDAAGRFPVILSYGPYAKGLPFQEGYPDQWRRLSSQHPEVLRGSTGRFQNWEAVDPEKWVPDGYVCVRVDSRGAGRSPGFLDPFSPRETLDFFLCIEWAAAQTWSNGKVGLLGISYYAINQWHVASLQPPHLAAMCPWEGAADWYRDMVRHGGIVNVFWDHWMQKQVITVQHGLGDRGPVNPNTGQPVAGPGTLTDEELAANRADLRRAILSHPLDDDYYQQRSPNWARVTVPFLSAANWGGQGLHPRGNFEGFLRAASREKWLEIHGLEHWTEFYTDYGLALQKRFFDHYLKGIENGWERQPPVLLQVRHVERFVPRAESAWPIPRTRWTRFYLDAQTNALAQQPAAGPGAVEYEALGQGVIFSTPPLAQETEITGPVAAKLFVSSSTTDADVFAVLRVFDPAGGEVDFQGALDPHTPIGQGWLRASHRRLDPELSTEWRPYHSHDRPERVAPGQVYELDVEIWPTSIVVPAGHRIALTVLGKDFERSGTGLHMKSFANELRGSGPFLHNDPEDRPRAAFGGRTTIHTGNAHPSYLLLPVVPA
jgi:predicted acyl esterase